MYRESRLLGWGIPVLAILMILAFAPGIGQTFSAGLRENYSRAPAMTSDAIIREERAVRALEQGPAVGNPSDYFHVAIRAQRLQAIKNRFEHEYQHRLSEEYRSQTTMLPATAVNLDGLMTKYEERFGHTQMAETAEQMRSWMNAQSASYAPAPKPHAYDGIGGKFLWGYLVAAQMGVLFYMARLKREGLLIWPEIMNGRLFAAALTIIAFAWVYPSRIDPLKQAKQAWHLVAGFVASVISFGAMAGFASASERKPGEDGAGTSNVLTLSDLPMPKISLSSGVMSAKVTGNGTRVNDDATFWADANASFQNGWDIDLSATRQARGFGSNENDYTLCKTSATGKDSSATGCLAYYDIVPVGKSKGGDMVSPSLGFSTLIGHGITAFAKADGYLLTGGPRGQNGYDLVLGLKGATHAGPVEFDHSLSAIYAGGPFRQKEGASLRFDESAAFPLRDRLKAVLNLKAFVPFKGARDRGKDISAGVGLAYAFN
jgi:hypothetical protein